MASLSLNPIVDVVVQVSPLSAPRRAFDTGLIIGSSTVISTSDRVQLYESTDAMLQDGFKATDEEYIAAQLYFSQSPRPTKLLVGVKGGSESFLEAVTACRAKNTEWYAVSCLDAAKADVVAIAAYIETATPTSVQFFTTSAADVPTATAGNVFASLKALKYSRTLGQYSTSSPYAAVSIMGYAMRANTGLANSAYTLKFKREPGVTAEALTATQVTAIAGDNGNVYINRGYYYDMFEQGVMANGQFFDEVINLDMLANNIQLNVMDKLYQFPKVPQTEAGVTQLVNACNQACDRAVLQGFLAPGVWTGQPILNLNTGDILPAGYLVQSEPINNQAQADREARKSPPIYVAIKEAGAIHSVTIGVYVSR